MYEIYYCKRGYEYVGEIYTSYVVSTGKLPLRIW